jgi:hypothetical protein
MEDLGTIIYYAVIAVIIVIFAVLGIQLLRGFIRWISTKIRKPDQIIQPWMFGHPETKATCLWLKNLPLLEPTNIVDGREQRVWKESPSPERWKKRSRTFQGIANAMADQWIE